mmetsp:Transcript_24578/g.56698  ORF Transcript_24578/g.56698 Transcript_24578/m.56698 type:complete len:206 (-) Transcript_24578:275-892(-)
MVLAAAFCSIFLFSPSSLADSALSLAASSPSSSALVEPALDDTSPLGDSLPSSLPSVRLERSRRWPLLLRLRPCLVRWPSRLRPLLPPRLRCVRRRPRLRLLPPPRRRCLRLPRLRLTLRLVDRSALLRERFLRSLPSIEPLPLAPASLSPSFMSWTFSAEVTALATNGSSAPCFSPSRILASACASSSVLHSHKAQRSWPAFRP